MADIEFAVHVGDQRQVGVITLNRPERLHALTYAMVQDLYQQLVTWQSDDQIGWVLLRATPGRMFCAGGDIREIYEAQGQAKNYQFFKDEYRLNYLIANYTKPYVSWIDGLNLGGGVGLCVHGTWCLASSRTQFAMPETAIGFYPDVGTTYWLSRLPDGVGMYMALTGASITAEDLNYFGWIDYVIDNLSIKDLESWLNIGNIKEHNCLTNAQIKPKVSALQTRHPWIKQVFTQATFDAMLQSLRQTPGAEETLKRLQTRSPLALKVTWAAIKKAQKLSLLECLCMEYQLTCRFLAEHDFYEGIRAVIIDKDYKPNWQFATLADVPCSIVNDYFRQTSSFNLLDN